MPGMPQEAEEEVKEGQLQRYWLRVGEVASLSFGRPLADLHQKEVNKWRVPGCSGL